MNHYPHHIGDFAKDTLGFSQGAIGAYRLLMDAYYANETAIAADDVYVIGRATTPAERKSVDKALTKFELKAGRYYHKRIEEELAAFRSRSAAGTTSAEKRWQKNAKADAKHDANSMPPECETLCQSHAAGMLASSQKPIKPKPPLAQASPGGVGTAPDSPPLAALAAVCLQHRVNTSGHKGLLHLRQMLSDGTTPENLLDAILLARDRKPDPEVIPIAYLAPILSDLRAGSITAKPRSSESVIAQAMANIAAKEAPNATH